MRKHFIVGTAGHVDHGKSSLIRALTGIETDRLPEEKARGLSIDLGFAHLELPGDVVAGIVDVPGHERFLKNMLAGVGGYDLGLLVIDAQEGVMPQTREHVEILQLLGTPLGLTVISKCDLVDADFLELVEEDLGRFLRGTFLETGPVLRVSSKTGAGLDVLKTTLARLLGSARPREGQGRARLPVDRAFLKAGFGTVVTGSLWSGSLRSGERVALWPGGESFKIRGLQVHGQEVEEAVAGQRLAVNLSGVEPGSLRRGMVLASPDWLTPTQRLDVRLTLSQRLPRPLQHRGRIRVYHGTGEVFGRLWLLRDDAYELAQLILDSPLVVLPGDRLVLRDFTSSYTLAGAQVVEPLANPHRRNDEAVWESLQSQESTGLEGRLWGRLDVHAARPLAQLSSQLQVPQGDVEAALARLEQAGRVAKLSKGWVRAEAVNEIAESLLGLLAGLQRSAPWKSGWRKEELLKILNEERPRLAEEVLQILLSRGDLEIHGRLICLPGHRAELPLALQAAHQRVADLLREARFTPPDWSDVPALVGLEPAGWRVLETFLVETGLVVKLSAELGFLQEILDQGLKLLRELPSPFPASAARDALQTSRKYMIPLLEYWDGIGFTRRQGESREVL